MSELKVHRFVSLDEVWPEANLGDDYYLKSEADKVIAELEDRLRHYPMMTALIESGNKEIAELKDQLQAAEKQIENLINSASNLMLAQDFVNDNKCAELRHHKYKRCLAMAVICFNRAERANCWKEEVKSRKRFEKWLALAEQFKEAK